MRRRTAAVAFAAITAFTLGTLGPTIAEGLPKVGAAAPHAFAEDADGRSIDVRAMGRRPVLVLYEDKDSATVNQPLKDDLARLAKGDKYLRAVALVPVADVSSYDFWPVKGFVRDAIRSESKKVGATIYCDFSGAFRSALALPRGTSSVVLLGKDANVLFARAGALSKDERARLIALLKGELGA